MVNCPFLNHQQRWCVNFQLPIWEVHFFSLWWLSSFQPGTFWEVSFGILDQEFVKRDSCWLFPGCTCFLPRPGSFCSEIVSSLCLKGCLIENTSPKLWKVASSGFRNHPSFYITLTCAAQNLHTDSDWFCHFKYGGHPNLRGFAGWNMAPSLGGLLYFILKWGFKWWYIPWTPWIFGGASFWAMPWIHIRKKEVFLKQWKLYHGNLVSCPSFCPSFWNLKYVLLKRFPSQAYTKIQKLGETGLQKSEALVKRWNKPTRKQKISPLGSSCCVHWRWSNLKKKCVCNLWSKNFLFRFKNLEDKMRSHIHVIPSSCPFKPCNETLEPDFFLEQWESGLKKENETSESSLAPSLTTNLFLERIKKTCHFSSFVGCKQLDISGFSALQLLRWLS